MRQQFVIKQKSSPTVLAGYSQDVTPQGPLLRNIFVGVLQVENHCARRSRLVWLYNVIFFLTIEVKRLLDYWYDEAAFDKVEIFGDKVRNSVILPSANFLKP
jgi:hypothetical protein